MNSKTLELIQMADICAACLMASGSTEEEIQARSKVVLAELVVRECANLFPNVYASIETEHGHASVIISDYIKQHFGLQE